LPLLLEPARAAVNTGRRLYEQVDQSRMQVFARDQGGGRCDQVVILRGDVTPQVDDTAWQDHMREERQAPRVRLRLRKIKQLDARRLQQHLDQRRFRRRAEHETIDAPFQQLHRGGRVLQVADGQFIRFHAIHGQQLPEQAGHARAFRPQVDLHALQLRQFRHRLVFAQEQPDGFRKQAAQGYEAMALGIGVLRRAALHEGDIGLAVIGGAAGFPASPATAARSP